LEKVLLKFGSVFEKFSSKKCFYIFNKNTILSVYCTFFLIPIKRKRGHFFKEEALRLLTFKRLGLIFSRRVVKKFFI
tara:strand:+ start:679 stop:909 length:231 start_codon:yes stop_codon:yes gene_type:complete